jgi:hypothetical protein
MPAPTPRTTPALVAGIIDIQAGFDVSPFIATANQIVSNVCGGSGYSDGYVGSLMELIERWISAHLYTIFDNQLSMAKAGTVAVGYQYKVALGLNNSMYGQQAMILDYDLNLAKLENSAQVVRKINIGVFWMGKKCYPGWLPDWSSITVEQ